MLRILNWHSIIKHMLLTMYVYLVVQINVIIGGIPWYNYVQEIQLPSLLNKIVF